MPGSFFNRERHSGFYMMSVNKCEALITKAYLFG